jgi:hypothetical protein
MCAWKMGSANVLAQLLLLNFVRLLWVEQYFLNHLGRFVQLRIGFADESGCAGF